MLKKVNFMVCELYLNKTIRQKKFSDVSTSEVPDMY